MSFYDHFGNVLSVTTYEPLMSQELHVIGWSLNSDEADIKGQWNFQQAQKIILGQKYVPISSASQNVL